MDLTNVWVPITCPGEDAEKNYGHPIESSPLVFMNSHDTAILGPGTHIGDAVTWYTQQLAHFAIPVFVENGKNRRCSVDWRKWLVLKHRPQVVDQLNCESLKKEDCKLEATNNQCMWDLQSNKKCLSKVS